MQRRFASAITVVAIVLGFVCLGYVSTGAQTPPGAAPKWTAPRTPDGQPDLQGVWDYATITPLERAPEFAGKATFTEEEAVAYEKKIAVVSDRDRRDGAGTDAVGDDGRSDVARAYNEFWWDNGSRVVSTRQTSLVIDPADGKIPPLTPEAQKRAASRAGARQGPAAGPEDRGAGERCLNWGVAGPPMVPGAYNNNVEILQTANYVVIFNEMIHDARIVPLDGRPHGTLPRWQGESRGRWEGDTLVVQTVNFTNKTSFRGATEKLQLVERFTRTAPDTLIYEFTVTDPDTWTKPWTARLPMNRNPQPIYEYACHEGNIGLIGILAGARADEKAQSGSR
jgi:hypothetical protein